MTKNRMTADPTTQDFKDFVANSFEFFEDKLDKNTPDQALVWVFMLAAFMIETMSEKSDSERKSIAADYLDQIHSKFQHFMSDGDEIGRPVNKRKI